MLILEIERKLMKVNRLLLLALTGVFFAPTALADNSFFQGASTKSALKDTSNLFTSSTRFGATIFRDASDPALYLNAVNVTTGSGWDPALGFSTDFASLNFDYTLGDLIPTGTFFDFDFAVRGGDVDSAVALGTYSFDVALIGGETSSSNDVLHNFSYTVEVVQAFTPNLTASASPSVLGPVGDQTTISMSITNTTGRSIVTDGLFTNGGAGSAYENMDFAFNFAGTPWLGGLALSAGESFTGAHSFYTVRASTAPGVYDARGGVYGGFFRGDEHWLPSSNNPTIEVVPEPATLAALGIVAVALRRKRK